jgi:hypothetical protein
VIVVVVAAATLVGIGLIKHGSSTATPSTPDSSKPAPPSSAILVRMSNPVGPPLHWGSLAIYDACSVLPLLTVLQDGLALDEESPIGFDRQERDLPAGPDTQHSDSPDGGITDCSYYSNNTEGVSLDIYQKPFNTDSDFQTRLTSLYGNAPAQQEDGFNVYIPPPDKPDHSKVFMIRDDGQVGVLINSTLDSDVLNGHTLSDVTAKLTDSVLQSLNKPPTGPPSLSYPNTPYAHVADPCTVLTGADFQQAFHLPDDGRPSYQYELGEWSLVPDPGVPLPTGYYVSTQCVRTSVAMDSNYMPSGQLTAVFDNYRTPDQLKTGMWGACTYYAPDLEAQKPIPITSVKIGDGPASFKDLGKDQLNPSAGDDWQMYFQAGSTLVELHSQQPAPTSAVPAMTAAMAPAAQQIAKALS